MKNQYRVVCLSLVLLLAAGLVSGCGVIKQVVGSTGLVASATPYPTSTPYPTYTPIPEEGVGTGNTWKINIVSAVRTLDYEGWSYDAGSGGEFIVVTAEITNLTSKTAIYYPKAIEMLYDNDPGYPGEAVEVGIYKTQSGEIYDFINNAPLITYINVGQTKTEEFAFEINATGHREFLFLFPGVDPIPFTVNN
jgi:hypothetical protein